MDPLTILMVAGVAFAIDILNDRVPVLRNITHTNVMNNSTQLLARRLDEILADPGAIETLGRGRLVEDSSRFRPTTQ